MSVWVEQQRQRHSALPELFERAFGELIEGECELRFTATRPAERVIVFAYHLPMPIVSRLYRTTSAGLSAIVHVHREHMLVHFNPGLTRDLMARWGNATGLDTSASAFRAVPAVPVEDDPQYGVWNRHLGKFYRRRR